MKFRITFYCTFLFIQAVLSYRYDRVDELAKRSRRMINGRDADHAKWPFVASFSFRQPGAPYQICTGTLISRSWLITAAHCVEDVKDKPEHLSVQIPKLRTKGNKADRFNVSRIVVHRRYILKQKIAKRSRPPVYSWDFDIALVKLSGSIPMQLPVSKIVKRKRGISNCKSAGWGSRNQLKNWNDIMLKNYKVSNKLQEIDIPLVPWRKCHDFFSRNHKTFATNNHHVFCGGYKEASENRGKSQNVVGGCIGDSGSPLLCKRCGKLELVGILLGGHPLCTLGKGYMIFTDVQKYAGWIARNIMN